MLGHSEEASRVSFIAEGDQEKALWDDKLNQLTAAYEDLATRHDGTVAWVALMDAIDDVEQWKLKAMLATAVHRLVQQ